MKDLKSVHECGLVQLRKFIVAFKLHIMSTDDVASPNAKLVFMIDVWMPNKKAAFLGKPSMHKHKCVYDATTKNLLFKGKPINATNRAEVIELIEEKLAIFFRRNERIERERD